MCRSKGFGHHIILLPIVLLIYQSNDAHAGASSTPKNLVNLNTPDDSSNATTSSQFQNEYQYRQTASKASPLDRYKSPTSPAPDLVYDHLVNDLSSLGATDYSYQDNRAMTNVPDCKGRIRMNGTRGYITDGSGYYQTNLQCTWLIDSGRNNSIIRIQLHQFNTECNYDFLYIFDGDSIYAPLVTALSGDMKDFSTYFMEPRNESMISIQDIQANSSDTSLRYTSNSAMTSNPGFDSRPIEFSTRSGKAFVYFHSDTAQSMPGFYMTYSVDSCPLDCSNRGECDYSNLTCRCNTGYHGDACQYTVCFDCSPDLGNCEPDKSCICREGWSGPNCSQSSGHATWKRVNIESTPKAFHQSITVDNIMWVFGGRSRELSNANMGIFRHKKTQMILAFDLEKKEWTDFVLDGVTGEDHLAELSSHSVAVFGKKIFIYGGIAMNNTVLDTLTVFDTKDKNLASLEVKKNSKTGFTPPIASVGHSANIIDGQMYIFLGYNPVYGYLNLVQKFNIANNSWSIIERKGSSVIGCIGHTSTYDQAGGLVYIFGGHSTQRSKNLHSFDPRSEKWTLLVAAPSPRYYHSSIIVDNTLVILGGNSYNISHQSDQCFQQSYLLYDLSCSSYSTGSNDKNESISDLACSQRCWQADDDPAKGLLKRYGHSVVKFKDELFLYGGFNGVPLDDIRTLALTNCSKMSTEKECNNSRFPSRCLWDNQEKICQHEIKNIASTLTNCTKNDVKTLQFACESRETCADCLNTSFGCVWCETFSQCQYKKCKSLSGKAILDPSMCQKSDVTVESTNSSMQGSELTHIEDEMDCKVDNCYLCYTKPYCSWQNEQCSYNSPNVMTSHLLPTTQDDTISDTTTTSSSTLGKSTNLFNQTRILQKFDPLNRSLITTLSNGLLSSSPPHSCDVPCYMRRSCNECTTTRCIWCSTSEQCIDSSAYFAYHTMGQCMHYVAHMLKCPVASCTDIETCDKCLTNPKCGWLNDISNTGKGRCMEGDMRGPSFTLSDQTNTSLAASLLPNWHYTNCPLCQCHGHSFCKANNNVCIQPCQDNTDGIHCDRCIPGFYGDPVNGGSCKPCRCNGHAQSCNRDTGKCYCSTKGIIGHDCNRCDDKNNYTRDPTSPNNGTCYYNLTTDYQYTFNMSKPEDHFYSDINFINVPLRKDSDVDFTIACSRLALVNITSGFKNRKLIHANLECGTFRLRFPHDRHALADANYSFFVHVYKFQTPFILQIAFSQHRTLYLPQFFFTFSSSFLFLFALSGLFYKLKHEYDLYMRRQRQFIEMEQMASRPFSTILLELFKPSSPATAQRPPEPTPISFEPCFGNNVGVLSLFVQLPGRPNLAIGSALVSLTDDSAMFEEENNSKRTEKSNTSVKNL